MRSHWSSTMAVNALMALPLLWPLGFFMLAALNF
jgi:hypothetical protein